ncbi:MAG: pectinesterase family protein [Candidatus Ventricola sp.]|nr:pectinesterase family protein [Candidatus Ventricola sp.]
MSAENVCLVLPNSGEGALQRAIDSLPQDGSPALLRLAPGVYREKVVLARPNTTLEGAGADCTRIVWGDAAYTLLADGRKRGTFRTATLRTDAPCITLRGLTIENDAAPREAAGQAIALYADGDGLLCEDCRLLGAQDTLFTAPLPPREIEKDGFIGPKQHAPRVAQHHVYRRCLISGDVDFIFGGAAAWFDRCTIQNIDGRSDRSTPYVGYATAASTPEGQRFGYVFSHCRFVGEGVPDGSVYLGRPWREFAKTVLVDCELGAHIAPAGFHDWNKPAAHDTAFYAECGSFGPGASGERCAFSHALSREEADALTLSAFLAHWRA